MGATIPVIKPRRSPSTMHSGPAAEQRLRRAIEVAPVNILASKDHKDSRIALVILSDHPPGGPTPSCVLPSRQHTRLPCFLSLCFCYDTGACSRH